MWKFYNSYEQMDHQQKSKELLRDEINNITLKIVKAREAKSNMKYNPDTGKLEGTWKVPEVESISRKFNEGVRYY